jgi:TP901 family phage tail tape measure protein
MATIVSVTRQDASLVGTALKTIYARMGDLEVDGVDEFGTSLGDVSGKMRQMGIDILDQEGNLRDMGGVIEEVAQKWGTWTDAQQQAAAVAIAGKRQYNNLIALFENWDMYESSLATSQNAEGTLADGITLPANSFVVIRL